MKTAVYEAPTVNLPIEADHAALKKLYRASSYLFSSSIQTSQEISYQIASAVVNELVGGGCRVLIHDPRLDQLITLAEAGTLFVFTPQEEFLIREVSRNGESRFDAETDSYLVVALKVRKRVIAVLSLYRATPFSAYDNHLIESFAERAAHALENALIKMSTEQANDKLFLLHRIIALASSSLSVEHVLKVACRELAYSLDFQQAVALLIEGDNWRVITEYLPDGQTLGVNRVFPRKPNAISEHLEQYKNPIEIHNAQDDPLMEDVTHILMQNNTASILILPLTARNEVVGILALGAIEAHSFLEEEVELAASIALAISQTLQNSLLHQELADHNSQLAEKIEQRTLQLSKMAERMTTILNSTTDSLIMTHADGTIRVTNPAFDNLFLYDPDEIFGDSITVLAEAAYVEKLQLLMEKVVRDGQPQRLEIIAKRKDGSSFDADLALAPLEEEPDSLKGMVCSLRDITHLKDIQRLKDGFVSTVSHELRTPLTGIMLSVGNLSKHYDRMQESQRQRTVERIHDQATQLAELIEDILALSRAESRKSAERLALLDMQALVTNVIEELQPNAAAAGLEVCNHIAPEALLTVGSRQDFSRIWRNIIGNGVKYTPSGGRIDVFLDKVTLDAGKPPEIAGVLPELAPGTYLIGQVADTGRGISPEDLGHIFDRFYRGNAAESTVPGTGLGLALVRELLIHYGGNIQVASTVGVGSSFTFWLPVKDEDGYDGTSAIG